MKSRDEFLRGLIDLHHSGAHPKRLLGYLLNWATALVEQGQSPDDAQAEVRAACTGQDTPASEAWTHTFSREDTKRTWLTWRPKKRPETSTQEE